MMTIESKDVARIICWVNEATAIELAGGPIEDNPCVQFLGDGVVAIWSAPHGLDASITRTA